MHLAMVREDFDTGDTELAIFCFQKTFVFLPSPLFFLGYPLYVSGP
jgi:hypothetical protein